MPYFFRCVKPNLIWFWIIWTENGYGGDLAPRNLVIPAPAAGFYAWFGEPTAQPGVGKVAQWWHHPAENRGQVGRSYESDHVDVSRPGSAASGGRPGSAGGGSTVSEMESFESVDLTGRVRPASAASRMSELSVGAGTVCSEASQMSMQVRPQAIPPQLMPRDVDREVACALCRACRVYRADSRLNLPARRRGCVFRSLWCRRGLHLGRRRGRLIDDGLPQRVRPLGLRARAGAAWSCGGRSRVAGQTWRRRAARRSRARGAGCMTSRRRTRGRRPLPRIDLRGRRGVWDRGGRREGRVRGGRGGRRGQASCRCSSRTAGRRACSCCSHSPRSGRRLREEAWTYVACFNGNGVVAESICALCPLLLTARPSRTRAASSVSACAHLLPRGWPPCDGHRNRNRTVTTSNLGR